MWKQLDVEVLREHVAAFEDLFEIHDALSVTLTDPDDVPVLEPGVGETPLWPKVVVSGLFDADMSFDTLLAAIAAVADTTAPAEIRISKVQDRDWERTWMDEFKPMKFGQDLWIVPGGQQAPEGGATVMQLDPGLAFGSGTHPTTRMCLEWIDAQVFQDCVVIDFGCGSGVLGIAAALKGAARILSVDNDPQALVATQDNAARNDVGQAIVVQEDGALPAEHADIIVANILAGTLVQLAPVLCAALKPGAGIALSGILKEQAREVAGKYESWLENIEIITLEDWVLISGTRREQYG